MQRRQGNEAPLQLPPGLLAEIGAKPGHHHKNAKVFSGGWVGYSLDVPRPGLNSVGGRGVGVRFRLSRRRFLATSGAATLALASPPVLADTRTETVSVQNESVTLTVNGRQHALDLDPRISPARSTLVAMAWGCLPACISILGCRPRIPRDGPTQSPVRVIAFRVRLYDFPAGEEN